MLFLDRSYIACTAVYTPIQEVYKLHSSSMYNVDPRFTNPVYCFWGVSGFSENQTAFRGPLSPYQTRTCVFWLDPESGHLELSTPGLAAAAVGHAEPLEAGHCCPGPEVWDRRPTLFAFQKRESLAAVLFVLLGVA